MVIAELCGPNGGYGETPSYFKKVAVNQTMDLKTNGTQSTGIITLTIIPPEIETAMPQMLKHLKQGLKSPPPPPPQFIG